MSKILVMGNGMDILDAKRGGFIDEYFDDVLITVYSVLFLDEFKEYLGTPTILIPPHKEWRLPSYIDLVDDINHDDHKRGFDGEYCSTFRDRIFNAIENSNIKTILKGYAPLEEGAKVNPSEYLVPMEFPMFNNSDEKIHINSSDGTNTDGTIGIMGDRKSVV